MNYTDEEINLVLKSDLMSFVHRCFMELQPTQQLSFAPHIQIMAAKVAETLLGKRSKRLVISVPPRSLKSITVSVAAVAWLLGHEPSKEIICASYGQDFANKLARDTRNIMTSSFYRRLFPHTVLSRDKTAVDDFATTGMGSRMATSVGGPITGRGAEVLIIDDPCKPDDALSATRRAAVNHWYDNTLQSRLNDKVNGIIIIVMQRLHQDDLVGHVLGRGEDWEVLEFPAIAEEEQEYRAETPLGQIVFKRKVGEVLDPVREPLHKLEELKLQIGPYNFSAQYQQRPTPVGGAMVKAEWLRYYEPSAPLPRFSTVLQSWDTANKSGELNDYSVCTTWGTHAGNYYLLDVFRRRLNYPELKRAVIEQIHAYNPSRVLIEDKASGTQLIQDLNAQGVVQVKPYIAPSQMDEILRLHAQTPKFEGGRVLLASNAPWVAEYVRELMTFPGSKFDDQVDSTTQALDYLGTISKNLEMWMKLGQNGQSI